jgi:RHS repeat-associated protein
MHSRNRRRVRQRASGRTVAYNLRFPGQVFDGQAGLHDNGYRAYDPAIGRYPTSDPSGLGGSLNPYSYAGANPISNFDPLGLYCTSAGGWTSCSYPGGPSFRLPTPKGGFPDIKTALLGLPAFFLFLRFRIIRWWSVLGSGLAIGARMGVIVGTPSRAQVPDMLLMAAAGAASALGFWFIWRQGHEVAEGGERSV